MKSKLFCSLFVLLVNVLVGFAQTAPLLTQLTQPYAVPTGMDEMALLNDLQGGIYVVYTEGGRFHVLRGADGQLVPYEVDFYGKTITNIHSLTTNPVGPGKFGCFVGTENGAERLYFFGIGASQKFAFYRNPLDDETVSGSIRQVQILARDLFIADVYYLKGDALFAARSPFNPDGEPARERVSQTDQRVRDYAAQKTWKNSTVVDYGWYRVERSDQKEGLILFKRPQDSVAQRESAGFVSSQAKIDMEEAERGDAGLSVIDGKSLRFLSFGDSGGVQESGFSTPGASHTWAWLGSPAIADGILVCAQADGERVYLVKDPFGSSPIFTLLPIGTALSDVDIAATEDSHVLIIFQNSDGWHSADWDPTTNALSRSQFPGNPTKLAVLRSTGSPNPQLLLFADDEPRTVSLLTYANHAWTSEMTLDRSNPPVDAEAYSLSEANTLIDEKTLGQGAVLLGIASEMIFIDPGTKRMERLSYQRQSRLRTNGIAYITILDKGSITIYRFEGAL